MAATGDDWAAQTADTIERVVGSVRGKTTEPLERIARILVYGLVASILGVAALVFLAILLVRVLDIAKPWPIRQVDRQVKGGFGVMADDLLAGAIGAVLLRLWQPYLPALVGRLLGGQAG